jgi:hypothetical protein
MPPEQVLLLATPFQRNWMIVRERRKARVRSNRFTDEVPSIVVNRKLIALPLASVW